ncbi:hypothetical protein GOP47_0027717 [Adiantum capillus-veneris]|nr:hypothetical protein GOP47_0027717 [Adiantum capillus-veneris]
MSKPEPIAETFGSQLALAPKGPPAFLISELLELINFRFAFLGKVLCKYGTYKIENAAYPRFLKADLVDQEARHTITFVVGESYISQFVESFGVGDFVCIEGASIKQRVHNDGGTFQLALHSDATTIAIKGEPFECDLVLFLEHRISDLLSLKETTTVDSVVTIAFIVVRIVTTAKTDGSSSARLMISDGPASSDRATINLFQILENLEF